MSRPAEREFGVGIESEANQYLILIPFLIGTPLSETSRCAKHKWRARNLTGYDDSGEQVLQA